MSLRTEGNVQKNYEIVQEDRGPSIQIIADMVNSNKKREKTRFARWIKHVKSLFKNGPKNLPEARRQSEIHLLWRHGTRHRRTRDLLTRARSKVSIGALEDRPEWKSVITQIKTESNLINFFDIRDVTITEWVVVDQTVNQTYYKHVLIKLRKKDLICERATQTHILWNIQYWEIRRVS